MEKQMRNQEEYTKKWNKKKDAFEPGGAKHLIERIKQNRCRRTDG
jgi:hypothetical protein